MQMRDTLTWGNILHRSLLTGERQDRHSRFAKLKQQSFEGKWGLVHALTDSMKAFLQRAHADLSREQLKDTKDQDFPKQAFEALLTLNRITSVDYSHRERFQAAIDFACGLCYEYGYGTSLDSEKAAAKYMATLAAKSCPPFENHEARERLRDLAPSCSVTINAKLGHYFLWRKQYDVALACFTRAADKGDALARCYQAAALQEYGEKERREEILALYRQACEQAQASEHMTEIVDQIFMYAKKFQVAEACELLIIYAANNKQKIVLNYINILRSSRFTTKFQEKIQLLLEKTLVGEQQLHLVPSLWYELGIYYLKSDQDRAYNYFMLAGNHAKSISNRVKIHLAKKEDTLALKLLSTLISKLQEELNSSKNSCYELVTILQEYADTYADVSWSLYKYYKFHQEKLGYPKSNTKLNENHSCKERLEASSVCRIKKNYKEEMRLYAFKAFLLGHREAQKELRKKIRVYLPKIIAHLKKNPVPEQEAQRCVFLLQESCSYYELAECYEQGIGCEKNEEKAIGYYLEFLRKYNDDKDKRVQTAAIKCGEYYEASEEIDKAVEACSKGLSFTPYQTVTLEVRKNYEESNKVLVNKLKGFAAAGCIKACLELIKFFNKVAAKSSNEKIFFLTEAYHMCKQAAEYDDFDSLTKMGYYQLNGSEFCPRNCQAALHFFIRALEEARRRQNAKGENLMLNEIRKLIGKLNNYSPEEIISHYHQAKNKIHCLQNFVANNDAALMFNTRTGKLVQLIARVLEDETIYNPVDQLDKIREQAQMLQLDSDDSYYQLIFSNELREESISTEHAQEKEKEKEKEREVPVENEINKFVSVMLNAIQTIFSDATLSWGKEYAAQWNEMKNILFDTQPDKRKKLLAICAMANQIIKQEAQKEAKREGKLFRLSFFDKKAPSELINVYQAIAKQDLDILLKMQEKIEARRNELGSNACATSSKVTLGLCSLNGDT